MRAVAPWVVVLWIVALLAGPAWAQDAPVAQDSAALTVTVVHASKAGETMDPKLARIAKYLTKSLKPYTAFKQLDEQGKTVKRGATASFLLPNGSKLELQLMAPDPKRQGFVKLHLTLDSLKTTVNVKDGGLFFQAGRVHEGGILVLAISARTAKGGAR